MLRVLKLGIKVILSILIRKLDDVASVMLLHNPSNLPMILIISKIDLDSLSNTKSVCVRHRNSLQANERTPDGIRTRAILIESQGTFL